MDNMSNRMDTHGWKRKDRRDKKITMKDAIGFDGITSNRNTYKRYEWLKLEEILVLQ